MYVCLDCKSHNIVDTEDYEAWFREGTMLRRRIISVHNNLNGDISKGFIAFCSELSTTATSFGNSKLEAINNLGKLLKDTYKVELLGKEID